MNENNPNQNMNWLNIIWNVCQTVSFLLIQFQQSQQHNYDRNSLETRALTARAEVAEKFGSANESIRRNQRNLDTTQRNLGIAALGGLAGGFILFRGGQKSIQKIKNDQTTAIDQVNKSITDQKTKNELALNKVNESIETLNTNLQNQIEQGQQATQETAQEIETRLNSLQKMSNELEGKLEASAKGGFGAGYASGGNISFGDGFFSRLQAGDEALLNNRIDARLYSPIRKLESKVTKLNERLIKVRLNAPISDSGSSTSNSVNSQPTTNLQKKTKTYLSATCPSPYKPASPPENMNFSLTAPNSLLNFNESINVNELSKEQKELLKEQLKKVSQDFMERLKNAPPESDSVVKDKPFKKDDDHGGDGDGGGNSGIPPVEVNYLFLNYTFNSNSINYNNVNTLIKVNKLFNSSFNLSTKHLYANKLPFKLNSLNNISNIKNINYYNLNNNLNNDNLINNDLNNNNLINHSKLSNNKVINNLDSCKELNNSINENKLLNIISNSSSYTSSTGNNSYSIGQKLNGDNINLIKPSKINYNNNSLKNINFNNGIETKEQINSFPIDEKNCSNSLLEDQLLNIRNQKHDEWINSKIDQNEFVNNQHELVLISNENNNLNSLIKKPLTKSILKCNNNDNLINLQINKSNDLLEFNSIEVTFISHSLYVEFLDLLICQLFFINKIINLNLGCFIYGSVIIPTIFTLNIFGCLLTVFIFSIIFNLFNQSILFILKNCLNKKNYNLVNSKLFLFYNIFFNILFLYIFYINILNISLISNLIILKSILLFNKNLLADLNYLNHKSIEVYDINLNNNKILNTFIYKSKRDL